MGGMNPKAALQMLALLLAGCAGAGDGDYPSLARRPIETRINDVPVPPAPAEPTEDPALAQEIDALVQKARAGATAFDAGLPAVRQRVNAAAGSAASSEAWVAAELAISTLESDRYESVFALASLDTLYVNRLNAIASGEALGGTEMIDRARMDVLALVDRQNDVLDGLRERLPVP